MRSFLYYFGGCSIAVTLLLSGLAHLLRFGRFRLGIRGHAIAPTSFAWPAAVAVTLLELSAGAAAAAALVKGRGGAGAFLGALMLGLGFLAYLVRLLRMPVRAESCGCSALESPLTSVSVAPAAVLIGSALVGLAALAMPPDAASPAPATALGVLWGTTLAGLALLAPATMPEPDSRRTWP